MDDWWPLGLPLWLPFLQTQEPLCHSAPASNAQVVFGRQRHTAPRDEFLTFSIRALRDTSPALCCSVWDYFDGCNWKQVQSVLMWSLGCFTDTLVYMLQTELVIFTCLLHLKPSNLLVSVFFHLIKPATSETSLIVPLSANFHDTNSDDVYLQNLFPSCWPLTLSPFCFTSSW